MMRQHSFDRIKFPEQTNEVNPTFTCKNDELVGLYYFFALLQLTPDPPRPAPLKKLPPVEISCCGGAMPVRYTYDRSKLFKKPRKQRTKKKTVLVATGKASIMYYIERTI